MPQHNRRFATSFIGITKTAEQREKKANAPLTSADYRTSLITKPIEGSKLLDEKVGWLKFGKHTVIKEGLVI